MPQVERVAAFIARQRNVPAGPPRRRSCVRRRGFRVPAPCPARTGAALESATERGPHRARHSRRGLVADAEFVAQLAAEFGLPFHLHRADVPAIDWQSGTGRAQRPPRRSTGELLAIRHAWIASPPATPGPIKPKPSCTASCAAPGLAGLAGILPVRRRPGPAAAWN